MIFLSRHALDSMTVVNGKTTTTTSAFHKVM